MNFHTGTLTLKRLIKYAEWFCVASQEFWVKNEEFVHMYEKRLGDAGYATFKLARTNNRGDGMLSPF